MRYVAHRDARAFLDRALPWLLRSEAEHNLLLGIAQGRASGAVPDEPPAWFGTVEEEGAVVGAAFRTPPHMLGVTALPGDGPRLVAEAAARDFEALPGVVGDPAAVRAVAGLWAATRPVEIRPDMEMLIHELRRLRWPEVARGGMLDPAGTDLETSPPAPPEGLFLWEVDGVPVSMGATAGATPNTMRVSYIYTPPEHRGRGYASGITAHLTLQILDAGYPAAVLYTDRDDPIPNHIYRKLGYEPVAAAVTVRFVGRDGSTRDGVEPAQPMPGTCLRRDDARD